MQLLKEKKHLTRVCNKTEGTSRDTILHFETLARPLVLSKHRTRKLFRNAFEF